MIKKTLQLKNKPEILYGFLCGVAMSVWILIEYALGFHTTSLEIGQISGYFSNLIPIIFIYIALHEFQEATSQKLSYIDGINI
ncbi:MAG: hypothetical protein PHP42_04360, partial [Bacteroidota bacterium]|nr:hypothetical protein [Bacteroidota bacterium]